MEAIVVPSQTPLEMVPTEERFGAVTSPPNVTRFGNDVVAASLTSKRLLVQKIFELPSVRVSVFIPREDVAIVPTVPPVPKRTPDNEPTDRFVTLVFVAKKLLDVAFVTTRLRMLATLAYKFETKLFVDVVQPFC